MSSTRDEALIADPVAAWDAAAGPWDEFVETGLDYWRTEVHGPPLLAGCGEVSGKRVLDLGCGQGWFSRQLAYSGAEVTAVDMSAAQIRNARRHEAEKPLGIAYHQLDAALIAEHWPAESFDLVSACMVLQDTPDAGEIFKAARRVLTLQGRMAFSIVHPIASTPFHEWVRDKAGVKGAMAVDRYFDSGPFVLNWTMERLTTHWATPAWHHTLSEWSAMITDAGFTIDLLDEPRPTAEQVARNPKFESAIRFPFFLIVGLRPIV
jgi:2-polyprenyl-3-methyl-5-hydroxy-6-metoxy-1,4-benzoquinol methylase